MHRLLALVGCVPSCSVDGLRPSTISGLATLPFFLCNREACAWLGVMTCRMSRAFQTLRLDGGSASELTSHLLEIVRACPTLEQLALLGLSRISRKDLSEAIMQLPELQVGARIHSMQPQYA
jgi:hypothetical protein